MKIITTNGFDSKQEVVVCGIFEGEGSFLRVLDAGVSGEIERAVKEKTFSAKFGEIYITRTTSLSYHRIIVVGMGKDKELTLERVRQLVGKTVKAVKGLKRVSFTTN